MLPKSVGWAKGTAFNSHENDTKSVLSQSNEFPDLRAATTTKPKVVPPVKKAAKAPAISRPTTSIPETIPSNDSEDERFESEDEIINESNPISGSHEGGDSEPVSHNNENIQPSPNKVTDPTMEENKASPVSLINIEKAADLEITARLEIKDVEEGVSLEHSTKEMPAEDNKNLEVVEEAEGEKNIEPSIELKDTITVQRPEFNRGPSPRSSFSTLKIDDIRRIDFPRRCTIHYFKDLNSTDNINPILERSIDQLDYRHINTPESLNVSNIDLNQDIITSQNNTNYVKEQAKVTASIKFVERIIDSPNSSYGQSHMFEVQPNLEVGLVNGREEISLDELFQIATPMSQIAEHQYTNGDEEVEGKNQNREQVSSNINLEQYQNINSNSIETEQPLPPNHSQNFRYMHPGNSNNPAHMLPNNYISMDSKNQHQNMIGPHNQAVMNSIEYQNRYNYNQNVPVDQNVKSFEHVAHRPEYKLPQGNEISALHPTNMPMHPPLQRPYYPMVPPNQGIPHGYIPRPAYHGPMAYPLPRPNVIPIPPQLPPMNHMPNHPFNGHIQYPSLNNMYMNPNQMHNYGPHSESPRLSGEGPEGEEDIVDLDNSESQESKVANIKKEGI
ncbi:hypothetical protein K502DRAFT_10222 [Neoconidiobolus thromboides FSU 785]|nr:hypothetical protein K502DRAFT_10222 [Neoconidiobolus thromboides FSU 785]